MSDEAQEPLTPQAALDQKYMRLALEQAEGCCVLLVSATFEPIAELAAQKLGVDAFLARRC